MEIFTKTQKRLTNYEREVEEQGEGWKKTRRKEQTLSNSPEKIKKQ